MNKSLLLILTILTTSTSYNYAALYVLGASYVANGEVTASPVGEGDSTGDDKSTNGNLWVEVFAQQNGHDNPISSTRTPNNGETATNFARGGAEIMNTQSGAGGTDRPKDATEQFNELQLYLQTNGAPLPSDVFVITSFGNDILYQYEEDSEVDLENLFLITRVNKLIDLIRQAQNAGFKNIIVANLPPIHLLPAAFSFFSAETRSSLQGDIDYFNAQLEQAVKELLIEEKSLNAMVLDMNTIISDAVANPADYGFSDSTTTIYSSDGQPTGAAPDQTMWWDDVHPSAKLNEIMAVDISPLVAPAVSIQLLAEGLIQIDFKGALYSSTTLTSWHKVSPQPSSPWTLSPSEANFYAAGWDD